MSRLNWKRITGSGLIGISMGYNIVSELIGQAARDNPHGAAAWDTMMVIGGLLLISAQIDKTNDGDGR